MAEADLRDALEGIITRCRQGDPKVNWLPTIAEIAERALAAPTQHRHVAEYPSACEGCEHLAADLARRLPPGLRPGNERVAALRVALRAVLTDMATFERNRLHDPNGLRSYREGMRALGYRVSEPVNIGGEPRGSVPRN